MSRHAALGRDWFMVHGVNLHQISNAALDALEQFVLHREDELEPAAMCAALRAIVAARNSRG